MLASHCSASFRAVSTQQAVLQQSPEDAQRRRASQSQRPSAFCTSGRAGTLARMPCMSERKMGRGARWNAPFQSPARQSESD